ncbi:hypothetical protein MASR2M69_01620 [Bacteroidota bacterium]
MRGNYYDIYPGRTEKSVGAYGEYTYTQGDKITVVAGLRADYNNYHGWLPAPRINIKYAFDEKLIFRASGGRGFPFNQHRSRQPGDVIYRQKGRCSGEP